jgi:amino acid permease
MAETRKIVMRPPTWALIAVAVVLIGVALVYFTTSATNLPAVFPGHEAGVTKTHTKHGLVMLGLAALALLGAWFTTAPQKVGTED